MEMKLLIIINILNYNILHLPLTDTAEQTIRSLFVKFCDSRDNIYIHREEGYWKFQGGGVSKAMSQNCNFLRDCKREGGGGKRSNLKLSVEGYTSIYFLEQHNTGKFICMCTNI